MKTKGESMNEKLNLKRKKRINRILKKKGSEQRK